MTKEMMLQAVNDAWCWCLEQSEKAPTVGKRMDAMKKLHHYQLMSYELKHTKEDKICLTN